jgi:DNA-binding transcriptional LysR family regulator
LKNEYPELVIELLSISRQLNVASREAEIAIVISYPPPSRHVIRKLGTVSLRLHASEDYLERSKPIREIADLRGHSFISYLDDHPFIPSETLARPEFEHFTNVGFSSNSIICQVSAAAAGAGIGLMPTYMARSHPNLKQVLCDEVVVPIDFYLLVHADLREIARYRATADFIVETVKRESDQFA